MISSGYLNYSIGSNGGYKLIVSVDQELVDYYKSLLPKSMDINQQRYSAHISVVRKAIPTELQHWGKYENESVDFEYSNLLEWNEKYCWIPVFCERLEEIRIELGLPRKVPWYNGFHITVGNFKDLS